MEWFASLLPATVVAAIALFAAIQLSGAGDVIPASVPSTTVAELQPATTVAVTVQTPTTVPTPTTEAARGRGDKPKGKPPKNNPNG